MIEKKYGMSIEYIELVLKQQRESCAICGKHWTQCKASKHSQYEVVFLQHLYVDHCHATGNVRGLLCNNCNTAIAMLDEDLPRFDAAKEYLLRHRATGGARPLSPI